MNKHGLLKPVTSGRTLANVFPSALAVLGVDEYKNILNFPDKKHIIVVLIDGLGAHQLQELRGHTPFLKQYNTNMIRSQVPSTTACSLSCLGTGLNVGQHGIIGYDVLDPDQNKVVNMLGWDAGIVNEQWQPYPSLFAVAAAWGITSFSVGAWAYKNSDLTKTVLSGSDYYAAETLDQLFKTALKKSSGDQPSLCYAYWNKIDHIGHKEGWKSAEYSRELENLDSALAHVTERLNEDTMLVLTADHGMLDTTAEQQIIIDDYPEIVELLENTAGEPRLPYLYCAQKHVAELKKRCEQAFGAYADVYTREEAINVGFFGEVRDEVASRIGNIVLIARDEYTFFHLDRVGMGPLSMVGHHGSLTALEQEIPLIFITR